MPAERAGTILDLSCAPPSRPAIPWRCCGRTMASRRRTREIVVEAMHYRTPRLRSPCFQKRPESGLQRFAYPLSRTDGSKMDASSSGASSRPRQACLQVAGVRNRTPGNRTTTPGNEQREIQAGARVLIYPVPAVFASPPWNRFPSLPPNWLWPSSGAGAVTKLWAVARAESHHRPWNHGSFPPPPRHGPAGALSQAGSHLTLVHGPD